MACTTTSGSGRRPAARAQRRAGKRLERAAPRPAPPAGPSPQTRQGAGSWDGEAGAPHGHGPCAVPTVFFFTFTMNFVGTAIPVHSSSRKKAPIRRASRVVRSLKYRVTRIRLPRPNSIKAFTGTRTSQLSAARVLHANERYAAACTASEELRSNHVHVQPYACACCACSQPFFVALPGVPPEADAPAPFSSSCFSFQNDAAFRILASCSSNAALAAAASAASVSNAVTRARRLCMSSAVPASDEPASG